MAALATKAELKAEQNKTVKLQAFDSCYFHDKSYFEDDSMQSYLVFQPVFRCFKNMLIAIMFQRENQKDCLVSTLNFLLHLIVLLQC